MRQLDKVKCRVVSPVHAKNTNMGVEVQVRVFIMSTVDGGEWFASRPDRFTVEEAPVFTEKENGCCPIMSFRSTKKGQYKHVKVLQW